MYIEFFLIIIIVILLFDYNNVFRRKKIVSKTIEEKDSFNWLKEKDYDFLYRVRYGKHANSRQGMLGRIQYFSLVTLTLMALNFATNFHPIYIMLSAFTGVLAFKLPYYRLKLQTIKERKKLDLLFVNYIKTLHVFIQEGNVIKAIASSIETAPDFFISSLSELNYELELGDTSFQPFQNFIDKNPLPNVSEAMFILYRLINNETVDLESALFDLSLNLSEKRNTLEKKYFDKQNQRLRLNYVYILVVNILLYVGIYLLLLYL